MKQLIIISDWASDPLRRQQMRSVVASYVHGQSAPRIFFIPSSQSDIHASFLAQQVTQTEERYGEPLETVMLIDCSASKTSDGEQLSASEQFICARLKSGMMVAGPNRAYSFSLLSDRIERVFSYSDVSTLSLFAARDEYASFVAHLMDALEDDLELEELPLTIIPRLSGSVIGHIDVAGAIMTTVRESEIKTMFSVEDEIPVTLGSYTCLARYVSNPREALDVSVFYPGSSGQPDDPYMEFMPVCSTIQFLPRFAMRIEDQVIRPGMRVSIPDVC